MSSTLDKVTELFWDRAKTLIHYPHSFHNIALFCLFSLPHFSFYHCPICFSKVSTNLMFYSKHMGLQRTETHWGEYNEGEMIRTQQATSQLPEDRNYTAGTLGTGTGMRSKTKLSLPSLSWVILLHSHDICASPHTPTLGSLSLHSRPQSRRGPRLSSNSPTPSSFFHASQTVIKFVSLLQLSQEWVSCLLARWRSDRLWLDVHHWFD